MDNAQEKKTFGLKPNESEMIRGELQRHNAALASLFSFIAVERLAYDVTNETAFNLSQDLKEMIIWENTPEAAPVDLGEDKTETAKAMEKK